MFFYWLPCSVIKHGGPLGDPRTAPCGYQPPTGWNLGLVLVAGCTAWTKDQSQVGLFLSRVGNEFETQDHQWLQYLFPFRIF